MKTALLSAWTAARRIGLWFAIRAVETQLYGIEEAMTLVRDPMTLGNMTIARHHGRRELARLRAEYIATFKPGVRRTWSAA
jgi:hypothetical protein